MHGCKHSSDLVTGILIGTVDQKVVKIVDVMPLFHTHSLAPMLKIACMLIEQHCRNLDLQIVGLYFAHPSGSLDVSPVKAIADTIASNLPAATLWALDLSKLPERKLAIVGHSPAKEDWKPFSADAVNVGEKAMEHTARVVSELKYLDVVDFDDHLADINQSWLNTDLFKGDALAQLQAEDK